ncbi:MAG: DUF4215 domain-containing protein [Polyangiaceae bacterium]
MPRFHPLWLVAPVLTCACSLINAPAEIDTGTGGGGTGGTGGTGGETTTTPTTTEPESVCGDGKLTGAEACDDDNTTPGDGCSATCTVEDGFECTNAMQELSICQKICGNGTVNTDKGEECDDGGAVDEDPPFGNQDACSDTCKFQEFDIESHSDQTIVHELPTVGFRNDDDMSSFYAIWSAASAGKVVGREYRFNGTFKKGTGSVDLANSNKPEPDGEVMCTAPNDRSVFAWRDAGTNKLFFRKIEIGGQLLDAAEIVIPQVQNRLSCASGPGNKTIVATVGKAMSGPLFDVFVQPFDIPALPSGPPIDIGDTLAPNDTASLALSSSFLVAWIADPNANGPIVAQQLDQDGNLQAGFFFTLTGPEDSAPREPALARVSANDTFVLAYTRDSAPDADGNSHREITLRVGTAGNDSGPIIVSASTANQREPVIAADPMTGKFVVAWTVDAAGGENIAYRVFDLASMSGGEELQANEVQLGEQTHPAVVADPGTGHVAILWDNLVPNSNKPHKISAKIFPALLKK